MDKTKIEWCDASWNPVTGCKHSCDYCYARGVAHRFCTQMWGADGATHVLDERKYFDNAPDGEYNMLQYVCDPYPYEFDPTFHRYRLDVPQKWAKPRNIFVCSMADLFGEWVPDSWIREVFAACEAAPQHRYLFLTKNPIRYTQLATEIMSAKAELWCGATITGCYMRRDQVPHFEHVTARRFLSIEPLTGNNLPKIGLYGGVLDWVILGAETGRRKNKTKPERGWIQDIADGCREANIPLYMKDNIKPYWDGELVTQFPW